MATTATKNGKPKRLRQQFIPGTEPPTVPKIERLADAYQEARDAWMELKQPMINKRTLLEVAMKEAMLRRYEMPDGRLVEITVEEKVVVRAAKKDKADAG